MNPKITSTHAELDAVMAEATQRATEIDLEKGCRLIIAMLDDNFKPCYFGTYGFDPEQVPSTLNALSLLTRATLEDYDE